MSSAGSIFDIQPCSVYDGPGIRTTVFLKGCNLRCKWCHNPESWEHRPQLFYFAEKCIGCGACTEQCPVQVHTLTESAHRMRREHCTRCGKCADTCYAGALRMSGQLMNAESLMGRIRAEKSYYQQSGGGVTFSGGEPLLQSEFLKEVLALCKSENIHTAVDTAGCVPYSHFEAILAVTDLFLFDLKANDSLLHEELTGKPNELIYQNLSRLLRAGKRVIVRIPCIRGANLQDIRPIAKRLKLLKREQGGLPEQVELLAYHRLGESKMKALSLDTEVFEAPSREEMQELVQEFNQNQIPVIFKE